MANRLARGTAWLAGKLTEHAGDAVTYHSADGAPPVELTATRGQTVFREEPLDNRGAAIQRSADFVFAADALRTALGRWPVAGDKISAPPSNAITGVDTVWHRVSSFGSEPVYRLESHAALIRVHTLELWED